VLVEQNDVNAFQAWLIFEQHVGEVFNS
jgi:hypothetical protein